MARLRNRRRIGSSFDDLLKRAGIYDDETVRVMPLTRSFKEFVKSRIEHDAKFRQALFQGAVQTLIDGDVETAKSVLRDYICHHRVSGAGRSDQDAAEKPDADVRSQE
jgi:hypothetical protein